MYKRFADTGKKNAYLSLEQPEILLSSLSMNTVSFTPVSPQHPPHMLAIEALCTNIPYRHALDTVHTEGVPGTLCEIWLCLFQMGLFVLQQKHSTYTSSEQ